MRTNSSYVMRVLQVLLILICLVTYFLYNNQRLLIFNPLTPNDSYRGRTAPLNSKRYILYIYSTNIGTKYFKQVIYSPFLSLQNAVCFIILTYLVPVFIHILYTGCVKIKKIIPAPKGPVFIHI